MPRKAQEVRDIDTWRDWLDATWPYALSALLGGLAVAGIVWLRGPTPTPKVEAARTIPDALRADPSSFSWTQLPEPSFPIPPYARFLKDVTIVIDPGHVGQRDRGGTWKRGPTGLREAYVNLNVARFLREFLDEAGARVALTREEDRGLDLDDDEDLDQRADVANRMQADLLISVHHNAADSPKANYTTVWYHRSADHSPASLDVAKSVLYGLHDALRLEQQIECGIQDDHLVYANGGFRLLRSARVPAVLCESSFHTNPDEESRLRDPLYNRREAYGLFLGLARWANAGLPRLRLVDPPDGKPQRGKPLTFALDDGLSNRGGMGKDTPKIIEETVRVEIDGKAAAFEFDARKHVVRVTPQGTGDRPFTVSVDFENVFGQHVLQPRITLPLGASESQQPPAPAAPRRLESLRRRGK
ncbi:MAG: N-acetylmuramoyl-L-alanine amidase [Phycisphaerae bacterium]